MTKPWEFGERRLWYYDFDSDRFEHRSSRSLFAEPGLNSPDVEDRLNRLIETPISQERAHLLEPGGGRVDVELPWPVFKALALLLLFQPFRFTEASGTDRTLEEALGRPDAHADGLAQAMATKYQLRRITIDRQSPLLYPSAGYFPLLGHRVDRGCALALAIPLSPWHVVVAEPRNVEWSLGPELWRSNGAGFVSNYSVGNVSRRIVVHPTAKDGIAEPTLRASIQSMRSGVLQAIALCAESARLLRQIDEIYRT